jgi:hypothetical protein
VKRSAIVPQAAVLLGAALLIGCHSYRVDATVRNRTGASIELLEVDYPSASFGVGSLAPGDSYQYHFQIRGSGPVKVQYTEIANHLLRQKTGPELFERQEGRLEIVLLPEGKTEFHSLLRPNQ